jgi:hypothetical protein
MVHRALPEIQVPTDRLEHLVLKEISALLEIRDHREMLDHKDQLAHKEFKEILDPLDS